MNTVICDKIRTLRDTCGLSQSALAKKIGVTRSAVNAWEMGLSIPTAQYIVAMAQLFHISTDYLLGLQNSQAIYQEESFLLPVMVDVLDIVIVLQRVNELLHIFNVPCVSELHIVLGYHFHLGGGKDIALPL